MDVIYSYLYLLKDGRCAGMHIPNIRDGDRLKIGRTNKGVDRFKSYLKSKTIILIAYVDPSVLNVAEKALKDYLSLFHSRSEGICQVGEEYFDDNIYEIYGNTKSFFLDNNIKILYDITCDNCINFKESCSNNELTDDIFDYCHTYHYDESHCLQCLYEYLYDNNIEGCNNCQ